MKYAALALLAAAPLLGIGNYPLHLLIMCLLWGYVYTSWSIMGRLGMVSFGHGAFLGIGAYVVVMGWNHYGLSPWIGTPIALALDRDRRLPHRLSVLPLQDRRPLLRAGHAGALGGHAAHHRRAARPDRRLAGRDAEDRARRSLLFADCAAVLQQAGVVLRGPRVLARRACGSGRRWTRAWGASRSRRSARRRTPPLRSASTSPG